MRVPTWSVLLLSMPAAACGGDDLTLPGQGDPAALSIVAGDGQRGPVGETLTDPLVVQLVDGAGLPVGGRAVVFRFTDDVPEAMVDPESVPTDTAAAATTEAGTGMVTVTTRQLVAVWPLRCAQGNSEDGMRAPRDARGITLTPEPPRRAA